MLDVLEHTLDDVGNELLGAVRDVLACQASEVDARIKEAIAERGLVHVEERDRLRQAERPLRVLRRGQTRAVVAVRVHDLAVAPDPLRKGQSVVPGGVLRQVDVDVGEIVPRALDATELDVALVGVVCDGEGEPAVPLVVAVAHDDVGAVDGKLGGHGVAAVVLRNVSALGAVVSGEAHGCLLLIN
eukprot:1888156-Prymnesium_polylepis.1